jgi:SIR2-like domain
MTMSAAENIEPVVLSDAARARLAAIGAAIAAGKLVPYLGPAALGDAPVPTSPEALAMALHKRVPVPGRDRGNMWGSAQFIEGRKHRKTLIALMADIFKPKAAPGALHHWLANVAPPMIVATWYDDALAQAFAATGRLDWGRMQGVTRALETRDIWTKAYAADGALVAPEKAATWATLIYEPHGSVSPAQNFLVADSDYVEVLTEIDIQTPIPDIVKTHRTDRGFVFLGCRFHDQMLRTFARQISKRSAGGHVVLVDGPLTKNERKFFAELAMEVIEGPLDQAIEALTV